MYDIAIIGCGPVGALAANFLGKQGWNVLVVEREANPYPLPRAVHLDHEMVRLFQDINLHDTILPDMRDTEGHLHVGADHGVLRYMGTSGKPRPFGWSNDYFFYQPELEEHLRNALTRFENVEVRLGTALTEIENIENAVKISLQTESGTNEVTANYVIACDGARSQVRKSLGIKLDDLDFEEPWLVVDAEVDGPVSFPPISDLPDGCDIQQLSVMMCDPNRPATVVPGRGNHRRWELMLLPGENDAEMMQPEKVAELLKPWLKNVPHNIVRAATYRFHGLVAEQWRLGNVFLAGDAAHQTPPFFGQGMCHGFRDAANLSWKLDLVLSRQSDDSLLDTYQAERDPHVRAVISAAVNAGRYICMLDPQQAAERDVTIREKVRRNELPTTAADLIPPVGTGIIAADTPKAGARFIQPWVQKGAERVLLDEITQGQWQLLVSGSSLSTNESSLLAAIQEQADIQATFLDDIDSPELDSWLKEANASAVLLRPDHYVYGTASAASLSDLLRSLAVQLLSSTTTFHFQERTQ
ncbi:bifunctional 3-(3-hydroxy-phenyl)propionate/3-hydroxycinnamic acid hydroxylase [uncultured Alteromonas sp.]|jgi:3-(3-hydroxy-phenyl)propionate hydroxylase|uniref:bifunctional 3-(3-hydroxy-phenyl)propionate/3-hydroxycinnamic acid hydroxylase MhpA n=1 Tax=uncultured Alteromonas sp. TaxID=179113 RepID=UPI0025D9C38D|nr:bifunctional 3-(3-hydroxy-phenyl)propionate/3-hydroxycinnamic acid hydroxylase [uncultured Alteromonas sp.]